MLYYLTRNLFFFFPLVVFKASNPFDGATRDVYVAIVSVSRYIAAHLDIISRDFSYHATFSNLLHSIYSHKRGRTWKRCYCQSEVKLERLRGLARFPVCFICTRLHYLARIIRWRISHSKSRSYYGRLFYRLSKFCDERSREREKERKTKGTRDTKAIA